MTDRAGTRPDSTPATVAAAVDEPAPAAVLWDLDGTIVDTEPYWMAEEAALVARHGGSWTRDDALAAVGAELLATARAVLERTGPVMTPDEVVQHLMRGVVERVARGAPWRPGARELLAALRRSGVPMALVTASWEPLASAVVAQLPDGTFATVVTGETVGRGKPHPEPYLTAAARLGVAPSRCVAVEDSPAGLASAEAAGCRVVAVQAVVPVPPAPGRSRLRTLTGVSVADLARVAAGEVLDRMSDDDHSAGGFVTGL